MLASPVVAASIPGGSAAGGAHAIGVAKHNATALILATSVDGRGTRYPQAVRVPPQR